jgi:hypothetical protein
MFGLENCEGARLAVVAALGHVAAVDAVGLPLPPEGTPNPTEDGAALPNGRHAAAAVVIHSTNGGTRPIAAVQPRPITEGGAFLEPAALSGCT